jgi:hypothetical protein
MGIFTQAKETLKAAKPGGSGVEDQMPQDTDPDDTSVLCAPSLSEHTPRIDVNAHRDEEQGSIITSMISQLRVGMDLSKVSFPTFVLEPRSMLERITDFMAHPDLIFGSAAPHQPYVYALC